MARLASCDCFTGSFTCCFGSSLFPSSSRENASSPNDCNRCAWASWLRTFSTAFCLLPSVFCAFPSGMVTLTPFAPAASGSFFVPAPKIKYMQKQKGISMIAAAMMTFRCCAFCGSCFISSAIGLRFKCERFDVCNRYLRTAAYQHNAPGQHENGKAPEQYPSPLPVGEGIVPPSYLLPEPAPPDTDSDALIGHRSSGLCSR